MNGFEGKGQLVLSLIWSKIDSVREHFDNEEKWCKQLESDEKCKEWCGRSERWRCCSIDHNEAASSHSQPLSIKAVIIIIKWRSYNIISDWVKHVSWHNVSLLYDTIKNCTRHQICFVLVLCSIHYYYHYHPIRNNVIYFIMCSVKFCQQSLGLYVFYIYKIIRIKKIVLFLIHFWKFNYCYHNYFIGFFKLIKL